MKPRPRLDTVLHGAALAIAAPVAAVGVTLGCFFRNLILWPEQFFREDASAAIGVHGRLRGYGFEDGVFPVVFALVMIVWIIALLRFALAEPRSPERLIMTGLAALVFAAAAVNSWMFAWPVCNSF